MTMRMTKSQVSWSMQGVRFAWAGVAEIYSESQFPRTVGQAMVGHSPREVSLVVETRAQAYTVCMQHLSRAPIAARSHK